MFSEVFNRNVHYKPFIFFGYEQFGYHFGFAKSQPIGRFFGQKVDRQLIGAEHVKIVEYAFSVRKINFNRRADFTFFTFENSFAYRRIYLRRYYSVLVDFN